VGWGATGLIEAAGLLRFRLNWARWGPMMHVSKRFSGFLVVDAILFFLTLFAASSLACPPSCR
jgi:hypothetical protein